MVGQVKSVKTVLKQLQQSIQTVTSAGWPSDEEMTPSNVADNFQWLTKDHLCILVYLVTVMHSMQVRGSSLKRECGSLSTEKLVNFHLDICHFLGGLHG